MLLELLVLCVYLLIGSVYGHGTTVFVDIKKGNNNNNGTILFPLKTINGARDMIRNMKSLPIGGVTVYIRGGDYYYANDNSILELNGSLDSGTNLSPITYTSYNDETVRLIGGVKLDYRAFHKSVFPNIYVTDLRRINITQENIGTLKSGGLGDCTSTSFMEFFANGSALYLARWPNYNLTTYQPQWTNIVNTSTGNYFEYSNDRQSKWIEEEDGWLHGYWVYDWADNYVKLNGGNASNNTLFIDKKTKPLYNYFKQDARYYGLNLFCELDFDNEYFIDRKNLLLYVYSSKPLSSNWTDLHVSISKIPLISSSSEQLMYVNFNGLNLIYGQNHGIQLNNIANIRCSNLFISNFGGNGLVLNGWNIIVENIKVESVGCVGIDISGGNQFTLENSNNIVQTSLFTNYARLCRTYQPGIKFEGVGHTFYKNVVNNAPHQGMSGGCNDCTFLKNIFSNLCFETSDSGAMYIGRSWVQRGNLFKENSFINIQSNLDASVQGIYFDDQISDHRVESNTFSNCHCGILIGGGRRIVVNNNKFIDCNTAIHLDSRGLSWEKTYCERNGTFEKQLIKYNYKQPPYSIRYPNLPFIFDELPCVPVFNVITNNIYCSNTDKYQFTDFDIKNATLLWNATISDNMNIGICR